MKGMLLALALYGSAEAGTLGIGLDVLPEAFSFAAGRVSYAPQLHLAQCDSLRCRWDLGQNVEMTAGLSEGTLGVNRIEAGLDGGRPTTKDSIAQYRKACLAIVALLDPQASSSEQRSIAASISEPSRDASQLELVTSASGYSFYGAGGSPATALRCGVATRAADVGSKL